MFAQNVTTDGRAHEAGLQFPHARDTRHDSGRAGLYQEQAWRSLGGIDWRLADDTNVLVSRWLDHRISLRHEEAESPKGRYVISIALRPTRLRLARGSLKLFEGVMPTGTLHVTGPAESLHAEFHTPCDFIHLHVAASYLRNRQTTALAGPRGDLRDFMICDALAAQLGRTLTESSNAGDWLYAESVGQTILMRLLALCPSTPRISALPKWRLRRVQEYVTAKMAEPVALADLASAVGLSRMHFAAQFRAATGCRPHEYLLQQRIERAKATLSSTNMPLVEVALSVGFQNQAHFSTVFKRLTGETPARWQRANRNL